MFRRRTKRKPLHEWSLREIVDCVVGCVTSDPDEKHARAAVVFYQDPSRLPENPEAEMRAEVEGRGQVWEGLQSMVVFQLDFDDDDRVACFMEGDMSVLVREWKVAGTEAEARQIAEEWVSTDGHSLGKWLPFDNIPGIYAGAFFETVTGRPVEPHTSHWMWALPAIDDSVVMRKYPPDVGATAEYPFVIMPLHVIEEMLEGRY